ncbi:MAG: amidase [Burkholderiaceae bacterium]
MSDYTPLGAPQNSLAEFGTALRRRAFTAVEYTCHMLGRIDALNPQLGAFTSIARDAALAQAAHVDALLTRGADLGPLMGVPVAVKDLFTVGGMPTFAGSRMDIADLVPPEGNFIGVLRRLGCIFLGKTTTTEFALGGYNLTHRLPWNPCDMHQQRMTSGSSHGSAVAMAAGLAGFALGSDTGGSVRAPAALCGVVGFKSTHDYWPCDGIFPLSPALDSVGVLTHSAADAVLIEAAFAGRDIGLIPNLERLTFAVPTTHFLDDLEDDVATCFTEALRRLRDAGVRLVPIELPEAAEIDPVFGGMVPADLLAFLGKDRIARQGDQLDPVARQRLAHAVDQSSDAYQACAARLGTLRQIIDNRLAGVDAWLSPTVPCLPAPTAGFDTVASVAAWNRHSTRNTRPGNLFGNCGVSLPVHHLGAALPVGLQLCATGGRDAALLGMAMAVEQALGRPGRQTHLRMQ